MTSPILFIIIIMILHWCFSFTSRKFFMKFTFKFVVSVYPTKISSDGEFFLYVGILLFVI